MNPNALLALISDLYGQVAALSEENVQLRKALAEVKEPPVTTSMPEYGNGVTSAPA